MNTRSFVLVLSVSLVAACSDSSSADDPLDSGPADGRAAVVDARAPDFTLVDGAPLDSALPDNALPDSAPPDSTSGPWVVPACTTISGFAGVGFGPKEAKTVNASKVAFPPGKSFTRGLVALDRPNTLLALHQTDLYRSENAGCSWKKVGKVDELDMQLVAGVGDRAWAFRVNSPLLHRIDGATVTTLSTPLKLIKGLGPHASNADRLRVGGDWGAIYESTNGGTSWLKVGSAAFSGVVYRVAFDPGDLDHILVGRSKKGFSVTHDGGKTWTIATGLTVTPGGSTNGFNAVISPASGKVVWASANDLTNTAPPSLGRQIYHSSDGGLTFTPMVIHQQHKDVILTNGLALWPHPTRASRLYFTFGTCASMYGTNLYRYDAAQKALSWDNLPFPGFGAIAVSPADPNFLYLGIHGNDDPLCP